MTSAPVGLFWFIKAAVQAAVQIGMAVFAQLVESRVVLVRPNFSAFETAFHRVISSDAIIAVL
jgi:hypothetical protein